MSISQQKSNPMEKMPEKAPAPKQSPDQMRQTEVKKVANKPEITSKAKELAVEAGTNMKALDPKFTKKEGTTKQTNESTPHTESQSLIHPDVEPATQNNETQTLKKADEVGPEGQNQQEAEQGKEQTDESPEQKAAKEAKDDFDKASEAAKEAKENADKTQSEVTEAKKALKEAEKSGNQEEIDKAKEALHKKQDELVEKRTEATKKAEEEVETAKKALEAAEKAKVEEVIAKAKEALKEAEKKLIQAKDGELNAREDILSDIEQTIEETANPELKEKLKDQAAKMRTERPSRGNNAPGNAGNAESKEGKSCTVDAMIQGGEQYIGIPYKWGGGHPLREFPPDKPKGLDCSGFVSACLVNAGVFSKGQAACARDFQSAANAKPYASFPRGGGDQSSQTSTETPGASSEKTESKTETSGSHGEGKEKKTTQEGKITKGTLMFWGRPATHVAICMGPPDANGNIQTFESNSSGGKCEKRSRKCSAKHSFGNHPSVT